MFIRLLTLLVLFSPIHMLYFTSIYKTRGLAQVERQMLKEFAIYIKEATDSGEEISGEIKEFYINAERKNRKAIAVQSFIENPLNSYQFMKRMFKGWSRVIALISCDKFAENWGILNLNNKLVQIEERYIGNRDVIEKDYNGLLSGLIRLWKTYDLDLKDLIGGRIYGEQSVPLTYDDILEVCRTLQEDKEYDDQVLWLEAWLNVQEEKRVPLSEMTTEIRALADALWKAGKREEAILLLENQKIEDPTNEHLIADIGLYKKDMESTLYDKTEAEYFDEMVALGGEEKASVARLCRGDGTRDIKITSQLKCQYRKTCIPFYLAKEELQSIDPRVSILYDVITRHERKTLKQLASAGLTDSTSYATGGLVAETRNRVSQTSWLYDSNSDPLVLRLSKRVQLITGLSTASKDSFILDAEALQVLNYGFGGMYVAHVDNLAGSNVDLSPGERLATWMFYLSSVRAGGSTVFPKLNITVPATEGAAVFWYNTMKNGETDPRLRHSGCPVLFGSKWVANKWIRANGQMFRRKCGLSVDSVDGLEDSKNGFCI